MSKISNLARPLPPPPPPSSRTRPGLYGWWLSALLSRGARGHPSGHRVASLPVSQHQWGKKGVGKHSSVLIMLWWEGKNRSSDRVVLQSINIINNDAHVSGRKDKFKSLFVVLNNSSLVKKAAL